MLVKIMAILAHPDLNTSRANRALCLELQRAGVLLHDLYGAYPDWNIDVKQEQQLLLEHDRIILQFPLYWYSSPPLLKKWFDDVLEYGWAYGSGGDQLKGKAFMVATTTGGSEKEYRSGGFNRYTLSELLRPIERTLTRCDAEFLPPFVTYNTTKATDVELMQEAQRYAETARMPSELLMS